MAIGEGENTVYASAAVVWKISIKRASGKPDAPDDVEGAMTANRFLPLAVTIPHGLAVRTILDHHRDSFNRLPSEPNAVILDDPDESNPYAPPGNPSPRADDRGPGLEVVEPASFRERTLASLIDVACACGLLVLGIVAIAVLGAIDKRIEQMIVNEIDFLVFALPACVCLSYAVAMQVSPFRATLGKLALGLQVRTARGGRASAARIVVRELLKCPGLVLYLSTHEAKLPFVDYNTAIPSPYPHDLLTGTRVLRVKPFGGPGTADTGR